MTTVGGPAPGLTIRVPPGIYRVAVPFWRDDRLFNAYYDVTAEGLVWMSWPRWYDNQKLVAQARAVAQLRVAKRGVSRELFEPVVKWLSRKLSR
jgi:hypothetical protein